tara:strand:- start:2160 stop:3005 length:846 start_codon:yes stop_codon:yes gene_type:complete
MGNRRMGRRRLDSLLERNYDSNDEWGFVRPPMVPGLQRNLRVIAIGQMHGFGMEDLTDVPVDGQTTSVWLRDDENSAPAPTLVANNADFKDGAFKITTGGAAADQTAILTAAEPFQCVTGKKWWVEASFKVDDIDTTEMFFGLVEASYTEGENLAVKAAAGGADSAGFCKNVHTTGAIKIRQNKDTDATNDIDISLDTAITLAADTDVLTLAIHWDGNGNIKYYGGRAATGSEVGALNLVKTVSASVPDQTMALVLQVAEAAGATAAESLTINYIRGAWEI